jgi:hypothetical protein
MKTLKKLIKLMTLLLSLFLSMSVNAQNEGTKINAFVRLYSTHGNKISKGYIISVNDSILKLKNKSKYEILNFKDIGYIKTKRSAGNNVLTGASIGAATGALLGIASADPEAWIFGYTASEGAAMGLISGGISGAAIGGLTIIFKNSKTFIINGDESNWKTFMQIIKK